MPRKSGSGQSLKYLVEVAANHSSDDCLLWPYAKTSKGYGALRIDGVLVYAHRFICELEHGSAPTLKHETAHSCGNGHLGCVNKKHLSWKTRQENHADQLIHGTRLLGELHPNSKLTEDRVRKIRASRLSNKKTGRLFGVSASTVSGIRSNQRWSWLQ